MPYSFLDAAYEVLSKADKPLIYQEVWHSAVEDGTASKVNSRGKTPDQSLGAQLYVDVRDNPDSKFIKVGKRPARFFLKSRASELSPATVSKIEKDEARGQSKQPGYKERDLHPLVAYFAYALPSFNRGRSIYTKTIYHETSKKRGYNEWIHPDMVGFYLPLEDWHPDVVEFNRVSDNNSIRLFSFELKRSLSKANYRESFFQAVSNSSWAHEGYLVAASILDDDDFLAELERLSASFGIGIISLDLTDIDSSRVLFPAKVRPDIDWEAMNKLCDQNKDFAKFIADVRIDFESRRLHPSEYDPVPGDPIKYIKETLGVKS